MNNSIMNTYGPRSVEFEKGQGVWLYDTEGKQYLDALSGIGVCALGHSHPAITEAICEQAGKLLHTSNLYHISTQKALAEKLINISGLSNCFFSNSGAEANEAAIKVARLFGNKKGVKNPTIIVFETSFHGRTMATLTASGNRKIQAGFEPLLNGFIRAPFNDVDAVKNIAANSNDVVAILVEPIQGEGGLNVPADDFLTELRQICDAQDWLLMLDEVQTGNGRTGQYFAYQHYDWLPDVVTTAKGLGNGIPIGACIAGEKAADILQPGSHGSTFGGNPLACATALATVNTIINEELIANAASQGQYIVNSLKERLTGNEKLVTIRGKGLMIGIELNQDCPELVKLAQDKGVLLNVTSGKVIRLLPPLILQTQEADKIIDTVCQLVEAL